jgi:hypothetical protein
VDQRALHLPSVPVFASSVTPSPSLTVVLDSLGDDVGTFARTRVRIVDAFIASRSVHDGKRRIETGMRTPVDVEPVRKALQSLPVHVPSLYLA